MGKPLYWIVFGILVGLLAAGLILLISAPSYSKPITILSTPTPFSIGVHISGQVQQPGVYYLPPGSRVENAILAAGGFTKDADVDLINLAAQLNDGQKLFIPEKGQENFTKIFYPTLTPLNSDKDFPDIIDLNSASQQELESLPGIGPAKAGEIIAYRQKIGRFVTIEEILDVPGIGPSLFEKIKDYITVSNSP